MNDANSGEVTREVPENHFGYVAMDVSQPVGDRRAAELLWGSLADACDEGGCEIHVHFRAGLINGGTAGDWRVIFNREIYWFDFVGFGDSGNYEGQKGDACEGRNVRQAVLLLYGKLVELPEGIVGGPLLSVVRLQVLDDCLRVWMDAPKHVVEFARILLDEDRKPRITLDILGYPPLFVGNGEFKREVVERGAKVVQTISNGKAEFGGRRWLENFGPKELLGAINIGFGPSWVRAFFEPKVYFGFKALQVVNHSAKSPFVVGGHSAEE